MYWYGKERNESADKQYKTWIQKILWGNNLIPVMSIEEFLLHEKFSAFSS